MSDSTVHLGAENAALQVKLAIERVEQKAAQLRAEIREAYSGPKRCGFLWLRTRPATRDEIDRRVYQSQCWAGSSFDEAWYAVYAADNELSRLKALQRAVGLGGVTSVQLDVDDARLLRKYRNP